MAFAHTAHECWNCSHSSWLLASRTPSPTKLYVTRDGSRWLCSPRRYFNFIMRVRSAGQIVSDVGSGGRMPGDAQVHPILQLWPPGPSYWRNDPHRLLPANLIVGFRLVCSWLKVSLDFTAWAPRPRRIPPWRIDPNKNSCPGGLGKQEHASYAQPSLFLSPTFHSPIKSNHPPKG